MRTVNKNLEVFKTLFYPLPLKTIQTFFFLFLLTASLQGAAQVQTLHGRVVGIADGDTFTLLVQDSLQMKVRVAHIDCPERNQPFSQKAKQFTSDAIFGKTVTVFYDKKDRYGRIIGEVYYQGGRNLSEELVKNGLAWHYVKYSKSKRLQLLEARARAQSIGLWSQPNAIAPWDWRKR